MRAVIQRVSAASVTVADERIGEINSGLLVLLGITQDDAGSMNRSLIDITGQALVVSQFTLHARTHKGTRPSFNDAAPPEIAEPLYEYFCAEFRDRLGPKSIATGKFGAMMKVALVNDGPVTLVLDTPNRE